MTATFGHTITVERWNSVAGFVRPEPQGFIGTADNAQHANALGGFGF